MPASFVNRENAVLILESGGILLMETDTLPGFHCRADRPTAVAGITALKGREKGTPLLLLAGSSKQTALVTGPVDARQRGLCSSCWPGPFSIILPAGKELSKDITGGLETVAVRVPGLGYLRDLILAVGFPLVSTSANFTGQTPAEDLAVAVDRFAHLVDGSFKPGDREPGSGEGEPLYEPSALVDATVWPPAVLRTGPRPLPRGTEQS